MGQTRGAGSGCLRAAARTSSCGRSTAALVLVVLAAPAASTFTAQLFAGSGANYPGNGGPATSASLAAPVTIAFTASGVAVFVDYSNNNVRIVYANGTIGLIAGTGSGTSSGDGGPATSAGFAGPSGVALSTDGTTVYVGEYTGARVRKFAYPSGTISTFAGTGTAGFSGDSGAASSAKISAPLGLATDSSGNV